MLKPWNPLFADYIDDYVARRSSTLRDPSGSGRYARYWKEAPETRGKTMRQLSVEDFERYRERRRQGGAIGAQRARGGASPSTTNKELSFARAVFNDFIASLEARGLLPNANPVRNRKAASLPTRRRLGPRWFGQSGDDEEARLRAELSDADWSKVLVAMHTGLDRGAQFSLRWSQVDLQTRTIQAERRKRRREGAVPVVIPINDELLAVLRALAVAACERVGLSEHA
jgi:integrase